jgi:lysophospholipase L1-like esterase
MARYYTALRAAAAGTGVARALQYGDSTIAADGISRTVRARLAARFGDAGPGFVSASLDPRWNGRSDVDGRRTGDWTIKTILLGGASGRYGLGGIVGIARPGAYAVARAVDAGGAPVPQKHLELWYQAGVGYGTFWASVDDRAVARAAATAPATEDRRFVLDVPEGFTRLAFGATDGPVPWYGLVLETGAPGITWESLGVIGVSSRSFTTYAKDGLAGQMAQRHPDLVVVMLGGNEAGYPVLTTGSGAGYVPVYAGALATIRAGAPDASCLVVTALDQGYVDEEGVERARPGMANLVAGQHQAATTAGCGFWSAYDAMGGAGAALKWAHTRGLGSGDLVHLSPAGLAVIGDHLADALLGDYDAWIAGR